MNKNVLTAKTQAHTKSILTKGIVYILLMEQSGMEMRRHIMVHYLLFKMEEFVGYLH